MSGTVLYAEGQTVRTFNERGKWMRRARAMPAYDTASASQRASVHHCDSHSSLPPVSWPLDTVHGSRFTVHGATWGSLVDGRIDVAPVSDRLQKLLYGCWSSIWGVKADLERWVG